MSSKNGREMVIFVIVRTCMPKCLWQNFLVVITLLLGLIGNSTLILGQPGSIDATFRTNLPLDGFIHKISFDENGRIIISGWFSTVDGVVIKQLARLNQDGSVDMSFIPNLPGGPFTGASGLGANNAIFLGSNGLFRLVKLFSNGERDIHFNARAGTVDSLAVVRVDSDGKILLGGVFYFGNRNTTIKRLLSSGEEDISFSNSTSGETWSIDIQKDGKLLIGGRYNFNGVYKGLFRLHPDGSIDEDFIVTGEPLARVKKVFVQEDGKILVFGCVQRGDALFDRLIRFEPNGQQDSTFKSALSDTSVIHQICVQPDGKVLLAGWLQFGDEPVRVVTRLNPDGSFDGNFNSSVAAGFFISSMAIQLDGRVVIAGGILSISRFESLLVRIETGLPATPVALPASNVSTTSFYANWSQAVGANEYFLDVSTDNFVTFLPGYHNSRVLSTNIKISGLSEDTQYHYRVKAIGLGGGSFYSNVISVRTPQKRSQQIFFPSVADKTFGDLPFTPNASSTSGLPISYSTSTPSRISITPDEVNMLLPGRATLTATQSGNEEFESAQPVTHTFCIKPSIPFVTSLPTGDGYLLISSASLGNQWYKDGVAIPGATNAFFSTNEPGEYSLNVTIDDCSSDISDKVVVLITSIGNLDKHADFTVFPNPASDFVYLDTKNLVDFRSFSLKIIDLMGRIHEPNLDFQDEYLRIETRMLIPGVYKLTLHSNGQTFARFFVKR